MVDNEMALTFSIRNNPGVFALLLGSGVSSEAEVPTGWGILTDLIRKVAAMEDEDPNPDPIDWYVESYGNEPGYDNLLEQLAQSKQERQALLEGYFEPTDQDRREGVKTPSDAHRNIAWLVDEGYITVIVTTNFDRLLEQALNDRGITPTVISTPEAAAGATPLAHADAVILKVNGDYKETNIKNTSSELNEYDSAVRSLLNQVFDEYGLIVCGWSGRWDTALRNAVLECESRRYSTFWAYHGDLEDDAEELVEHRDGISLQIEGASAFFSELRENVQALEAAEAGAPLTREVARERVKRYMTREERKIDLADLIQEETERVRNRLFDEAAYPLDSTWDGDAIEARLDAYDSEIETLFIASSTCAYWGPSVVNSATEHLAKMVRRLGTLPSPEGSYKREWRQLRRYSGTVLIFGMGVPALESENWDLIYRLLEGTAIPSSSLSSESVVVALNPGRIGEWLPSNLMTSGTTTVKRRIKQGIYQLLQELVTDADRYEELFFEFEALTDSVLYHRFEKEVGMRDPVVPDRLYRPEKIAQFIEEVELNGEEWAPVQAGLFGGSADRAAEVLEQFR